MSDTLALVRFGDGTLAAAYFFGDPEVVVPILVPIENAEELFARGLDALIEETSAIDTSVEPADTEPVEIWAPYGRISWWEGRASRSTMRLVEGDGAEPVLRHPGTPDWVPDDWRLEEDQEAGEAFMAGSDALADWMLFEGDAPEVGSPSGETAFDVLRRFAEEQGITGEDPPPWA